jgi:thiol-disulfide isomerase/thioredoxin
LGEQNPSLLLALSPDAGKQLIAGATKIARAADVSIGTTAYPTISFMRDLVAYQVLIDPKTHFLRQVRVDQKRLAEKRGRTDVTAMMLTIDYTKTTPSATFPDALFNWSAPKTATAMKTESEEPSEPGEPATALVGQPAPDFTLNGLDGKAVTLADLKGSVVVLDFWATWCGPCVASMPHLDRLLKEKSPDGLKLYAIDLREDQAKVQKFIEAKQLSLPVLLDTKGDTAKKYLVSGIPQTVVVGKDGTVKKVIIGFGGDESELRAAIEAAMQAQ